MADDSSTNNKKISPKLEEFNSSLRIKLKLPKHEQDLASPQQHQNHLIINSAPLNDDEDELEEGEIKQDEVTPPPPPPPQQPTLQVDDDDGVVQVNLRICPFCNKTFSNGKALGGHMRVHAAVNHQSTKSKKKVSTTLGSPSSPTPTPSPNNEVVFKCILCPKEFPSLKSLFGHMRSHPDRLWRGMNPPTPPLTAFTAAGAVAESSSAAEARLRSLGTWRVTGKRGRKAAYSSSPVTSSSSASFGSHAEAAADLMLLLNGGGGGDHDLDDYDDEVVKKNNNKKGKGLMFMDDDDDDNKLFDEDEVYYLKNLGVLPNYKFDDDGGDDMIVTNKFDDDGDEAIKVDYPPSSTPSKIKGINKKVGKINHKIKDDMEYIDNNHPNNNENINKWVCTTCGKSFPTHQALGGHRSSHNKDKYNNNNNNNNAMFVVQTRVVDGSGLTDTGPSTGNTGGGDNSQIEMVVNEASQDDVAVGATGVQALAAVLHKCKICNKTFTSGQALGGHQRCHYVPFSDVSLSSGQTCQTSRKGQLELFDLNVEPPMMDDDDNDDDAGDVTFDSTSSKYCSY